ncbi:MAG: oligosaccharide flippase family protein [Acidobacteriia bacterium]|nr:oligosaccharide flippase family protein [Terriglobia bacterium]
MTLRQKTKEALLWGAGFRVIRDVTQFAIMLVLVRLLTPTDYGRYGLLTSVIGFLGLFSARTFLAHIVQVRGDQEVHAQDHFTAGAAIQASLFVGANLLGVVLRFSDSYRPIAGLLHVASLIFLVELPGELDSKLIERGLEFRRLRTLNAAGVVLTAALALSLAVSGAGVYALVVPPLVISIPFAVDLFCRARFRPTWAFARQRYRPALDFGLARLASGVMNGVRDLVQSGLIVRLLSYATLGFYGRAVGLGNVVCSSVTSQFVGNVYPVLTRQEASSPAFRRASGLMLRGVAWIAVPIALVLSLHAAPVVHTLYGGKWDAVVPLLPAAMLENAVRAVAFTLYFVLLGALQHRRCLIQDALMLLLVLGALAVGLPGGPGRYLLLLAAAEAVGGALMLAWLLRDRTLEPRDLVAAFVPPVLAGAIGYAAYRAVAVAAAPGPVLLGAALTGTSFLLAYGLALRVGFPTKLAEMLHFLPGGGTVARMLRMGDRSVTTPDGNA